MTVDETLEPASDRCSLHPGSQAVATCEGCGRPMCLWCAVPVRGAAYGNECLGPILGEVRPGEEEIVRPRAPTRVLVGFALALGATLLPWTTFGEGSSLLGAWGLSPRWSTIAAVAAALGVVAAVVRRRRAHPDRAWDVAEIVLGAVVTVASIVAWFRPPFPSRPSIVAWLAAGAGLFAGLSAVRCLREDARSVS